MISTHKMPSNFRTPTVLYMLGIHWLCSCARGFTPWMLARASNRLIMSNSYGGQREENAEILVHAHFLLEDRERIETLSQQLASTTGGRVSVILRPQGEGNESESSSGERFNGDGAHLEKGCLPAFRLERQGLAIDEYHTHGDAPYEEELIKRVEAALSLSRPEDAATLKELWCPDAAGGDYGDEMAVVTYIVQVASHVARELQGELCQAEAISKLDSSPVTVGDFTVQALVLGVLKRYFPDHGFIAEETSAVLCQDQSAMKYVLRVVSTVLGREDLTNAELCAAIDLGTRGHGKQERGRRGRGGRTFVLDPIDGTKGFLRGEQFCVALGLLDGGKPVAGVLGCPNLPAGSLHPSQDSSGKAKSGEARGLLYSAALREGTFVRSLSAGADDSRRVFVGHARKPRDTRVLESVEALHTSHAVAAQVCSDLGISLPPIRVDGQCKYGLLSEGQRGRCAVRVFVCVEGWRDGFRLTWFAALAKQGGIYLRLPRWGYREWIWDHLAGVVVVTEAGGKVTDTRGETLDFSLGAKLPQEVVGVVATSGNIHCEVLRAVHNRQLQDWARVVAEAKAKGWDGEGAAPPLPGVAWAPFGGGGGAGTGEAWQVTALSQRRPLVMRTSEQFYGTLERGWDKLVAVLFHGEWTQESQHAVSLIESLAHQQQQMQPPRVGQHHDRQGEPERHELRRYRSEYADPAAGKSPPPSSPSAATAMTPPSASVTRRTSETAAAASALRSEADAMRSGGVQVLLAEANVMSLIEVADRQAVGTIPSLQLFFGGREVLRFPVHSSETVESLRERIDDLAERLGHAGST